MCLYRQTSQVVLAAIQRQQNNMGSSVSVYVGPYIKINLKETTYNRDILCCTNMLCKEYREPVSDTFCRACGSMIVVSTVPKTGSLNWSSFNEHTKYAYESDFCSPEYLGDENNDIVICDEDGTYLDYEGGNLPLSEADFNVRRLVDFETKHKTPLDAIRAYFPNGHVTIEIGVCAYWS